MKRPPKEVYVLLLTPGTGMAFDKLDDAFAYRTRYEAIYEPDTYAIVTYVLAPVRKPKRKRKR